MRRLSRFALVLLLSWGALAPLGAEPLGASAVLQEFSRDRDGAAAAWAGRSLTAQGVVAEVRSDLLGRAYVALGPTGPRDLKTLRFYFEAADAPGLLTLFAGQKLTVAGVFEPNSAGVAFGRSRIIDNPAAGKPIVYRRAVKAPALVALFRQNALAASAVYLGQEVEVTGLIAAVDLDFFSKAPILSLSGYDRLNFGLGGVVCPMPVKTGPFQVGQTVTVVGVVADYLLGVDLIKARLP